MSRAKGSTTYPPEFRLRVGMAADKAITSGEKTLADVAREFGVSAGSVKGWRRQYQESQAKETAVTSSNGHEGGGAVLVPTPVDPPPVPPTAAGVDLLVLAESMQGMNEHYATLQDQVIQLTRERDELNARLAVQQAKLRDQAGEVEIYRAALAREMQRNESA